MQITFICPICHSTSTAEVDNPKFDDEGDPEDTYFFCKDCCKKFKISF